MSMAHHLQKKTTTRQKNLKTWKLFPMLKYDKKPSANQTRETKIKEIPNFPNQHPGFPNYWRIYSTLHTSLPPSHKRNNAHKENFVESPLKSTKEEEYKIKSIISMEKNLPISSNKKVTPLERKLMNWNKIYYMHKAHPQHIKDDTGYRRISISTIGKTFITMKTEQLRFYTFSSNFRNKQSNSFLSNSIKITKLYDKTTTPSIDQKT
jgi:hypothetical protein